MGAGSSRKVSPTLEVSVNHAITKPVAKTTMSQETLVSRLDASASASDSASASASAKCNTQDIEDSINELEFLIKNEVVLEDLNNKVKLQDKELKDLSENKYKNIRHIKNTIAKYRDESTTKRIYLIIIIILVLMFLSLGYLFYKRFNSTGKLTTKFDF
jgi:t-SNARE complex subunit (syntaxin)